MVSELIDLLAAQTLRMSILIVLLFFIRWFGQNRLSPKIRCSLWLLVPLVLILSNWLTVPFPEIAQFVESKEIGQKIETIPEITSERTTEIETETESKRDSGLKPRNNISFSNEMEFSDQLSSSRKKDFDYENEAAATSTLVEPKEMDVLNETVISKIVSSTVEPTVEPTVGPETVEPTTSEAGFFPGILIHFIATIMTMSELLNRYSMVIFIVWFVGFCAMLVYLIRNAFRCRSWIRMAVPVEESEILAVYKMAIETTGYRFGIQNSATRTFPSPIWSVSFSSPAIIGFFRPKLLLPCSLGETLSPEQFYSIFLHELVHYQRRDLFWGWIAYVVLAFHWFNPLLWLAVRGLHVDQEEACDDHVLALADGPGFACYVETLYKVIRHQKSSVSFPGLAGMISNSNQIKRRIEMMSLSGTWKRTWAAIGISAALLAFCVGLITFTNSGKSEAIFAGETFQLEKTVNQILSPNDNATASNDNATAGSIVSNAALDAAISPASQKIRVLFIYGGHDYDKLSMERLLAWLGESGDIEIDRTHLPENRSLLSPKLAKRYDCLIRYDQDQPTLSDEEMQSLNSLYEAGIGVIALHHHIGAYSSRPDFWKTMGGYYVREGNKTVTGKEVPVSSWIDDVPMTIHIENPLHPITEGMSDFDVVDEAYDNVYVDEKAEILLSTDEPKASPPVAWLWENGNSPVFTFLLGHGPSAFENPAFRQILRNAIFYLSMETNNRRASMEPSPETDQLDQNPLLNIDQESTPQRQ